jgi:hypothetical protein
MIFSNCEEHANLDPKEERDCNYCQQCKTWEHKKTCFAEANRFVPVEQSENRKQVKK